LSAEEFHKHKPKDIQPQGVGSTLDADKVDGLHASEIGSGMIQHANEWHDPDMALATHNHNLNDLTEKSHVSLTDKGTNTHAQVDTHLAAASPHSGHELTSTKNAANGYAGLSAGSKVAASQMPTATITRTLVFSVVGTLTTGTYKAPIIIADGSLTIVKVKIVLKTPPTGAGSAVTVDVNKGTTSANGTTIFTTQGNRPSITVASGLDYDDSGTPDVTAISENDHLSIDIDAIGGTVAGADLTVEVVCTQAVTFS